MEVEVVEGDNISSYGIILVSFTPELRRDETMFSPGHLGPTQTPVQPKEQGLPGVSAGGGGEGGATSCLAVIHSVILGMMGPLESEKPREHEVCVVTVST